MLVFLLLFLSLLFSFFFFFNDTATTEIYTLSLHDALPICRSAGGDPDVFRRGAKLLDRGVGVQPVSDRASVVEDRKSTRLNSSHPSISYAVFCLKKKKINNKKNEHRREEQHTFKHGMH